MRRVSPEGWRVLLVCMHPAWPFAVREHSVWLTPGVASDAGGPAPPLWLTCFLGAAWAGVALGAQPGGGPGTCARFPSMHPRVCVC